MKEKIYLWGDSIGRGVIYNPERRRYCLSTDRCERVLQAKGVDLENYARMGATIRQGIEDFMETKVEPGGTVVIEYGGNDCDLDWQAVSERPDLFHDGKTPLDEFSCLLRTFAREVRRRGLKPVMVLPPPLLSKRYFEWVCRNRDADSVLLYLGDVEHIGRWHACYVEAIREAARDTGSEVFDVYSPFLRALNFPSLICADGIHPNSAGQQLIAAEALKALKLEYT